MNIGAKIKQLRQLNGMDQKELANKLNISNKTVSSWESNRTQPKMEMIELLCEIFGCQKTDFMDENDYSLKLNDEEVKLILEYRKTDSSSKEMINRILHYVDSANKQRKE